MSLIFSSRCMLELKFAIYYRAVSLPSQASYAVLTEESLGFLQRLPAHQQFSNSAILRNNYISLLSICAHAYTERKMASQRKP